MNELLKMFGAGILGQGLAGQAAGDLELRKKWLLLKEQEALGEIPSLPDYNTWKKNYLRDQSRKAANNDEV